MDRPNIKDYVYNNGGSGEFISYREYSLDQDKYINRLITNNINAKEPTTNKQGYTGKCQHCAYRPDRVKRQCEERK